MKRTILLFAVTLFISFQLKAESSYPVRGLCIVAPGPDLVDEFVNFIDNELADAGLNLLILRVDWKYDYQSRPELAGDNPLSVADVKKLVNVCRDNNIRLIPQINLFGHQSWHSTLGKLLEVYPEFDETPDIELPPPGTYEWPNEDGLYCKS